MDNSDKKEFATLIYAMGEYYDKNVSTQLLSMYFDDLIQFSINKVKYGSKLHRVDSKHGTFFPKPADIIRHLNVKEISTEQKAELSWGQIEGKIRTVGSYGKLNIDDKQALASLKAFTTWKELCAMDVNKLTWAKKEFISMYSTYENTPIEMLPSSLPGRLELVKHKENSSRSIKSLIDGIKNNRIFNDR